MDEVAVRTEPSRPAFEPTRSERLRIWAICLTLAAAAQLAVVSALAPIAEPRYIVQLEAVERRAMFVPSRFSQPVPTATPEALSEPEPTPEPSPVPKPHGAAARTARPTPARTARPTLAPSPAPTPTPAPRPSLALTPAPEAEDTPAAQSGDIGQAQPGPHPEGGIGKTASPGDTGDADASGGAGPRTIRNGSPTAQHPSPALWAQDVGTRLSQGLRYPRAAEEDGVEGVTLLRLHVEADGHIVSIALVRSSGDTRLDEAALARARALKRLPPPPPGTHAIDVPVRFRLP